MTTAEYLYIAGLIWLALCLSSARRASGKPTFAAIPAALMALIPFLAYALDDGSES